MLALLTITTMQMLDFTGTFGALINAAGISNAPGSGDTYVMGLGEGDCDGGVVWSVHVRHTQ